MDLVIPAPPPVLLPVSGETARFPVRRIFCVGRNYADHAKEMGAAAEPVFFMKPADAAIAETRLPYPDATQDLHHEIELVLALGDEGEIWGSGVGVDLTRRDLQAAMKEKRAPWEIGKAFDASAPVGALRAGPPPSSGAITLSVDGETRQAGDLAQMILPPAALLEALSRYFTLRPGDLIFTGTPAGVGPVLRSQTVAGRIDGLPPLDFTLV